MLLKWFRRKIKKWLADPKPPPERIMDAVIDGAITRVLITGIVGMQLMATIIRTGGGGQRMIFEYQAVDRTHFWALWKDLGGVATWEDGTPFEPPE